VADHPDRPPPSAPSTAYHGTTCSNPRETMRFFTGPQRPEESLLWSRDISFVYRLAQVVMGGRLLELESGVCLIAPAAELTDGRAVAVGRESHSPEFGLVHVDSSIP